MKKNYKTILSVVKFVVLFVLIIKIILHLALSLHRMEFQNNSGAVIAKIKFVVGSKTIEYKNIQPVEMVYFDFFNPFEKDVKIEIHSTKCGTTKQNITIKSEFLFDYYNQVQLWHDCQFQTGELYLFDEKLLNK